MEDLPACATAIKSAMSPSGIGGDTISSSPTEGDRALVARSCPHYVCHESCAFGREIDVERMRRTHGCG